MSNDVGGAIFVIVLFLCIGAVIGYFGGNYISPYTTNQAIQSNVMPDTTTTGNYTMTLSNEICPTCHNASNVIPIGLETKQSAGAAVPNGYIDYYCKADGSTFSVYNSEIAKRCS
jgi:hypothetical protein